MKLENFEKAQELRKCIKNIDETFEKVEHARNYPETFMIKVEGTKRSAAVFDGKESEEIREEIDYCLDRILHKLKKERDQLVSEFEALE